VHTQTSVSVHPLMDPDHALNDIAFYPTPPREPRPTGPCGESAAMWACTLLLAGIIVCFGLGGMALQYVHTHRYTEDDLRAEADALAQWCAADPCLVHTMPSSCAAWVAVMTAPHAP